MGKRKEYVKITATSDNASHFAEAVCDKSKIDEIKRRCAKSVIDFAYDLDEININIKVEPTQEVPMDGVDIMILPVKPVAATQQDDGVIVVNLGD